MGRLAQQLAGPGRDALLEELSRAFADEWCAHYNYSFVAYVVSGPASPGLARLLRGKAARALRHADRLAARILELGGQPPAKIGELIERATDKPFKLPEDVRDLDGILKAVLDAERTSLRTYHELERRTADGDPITHALALDLEGAAVRGEQELERLLGAPAPEMDGR